MLATVLGGSVVALIRNSKAGDREVAAREMAADLRSFREAAVARPPGSDLFAFAESYLRTHAVAAGSAVIIAVPGHGTVGSPGTGPALSDPVVREKLEVTPSRTLLSDVHVAGQHDEMLTAPLTEGGRTVGTFLSTADLGIFDSVQARIARVSALEAVIALVVGVASVFLLLRRLLRTIGRMTTTADRIGRGEMDERLGDQGTDDEVGQLAQSLDRMLDRVEGAVGAQRRLLSDVSHQLRTPVTVARGHLEVLSRTDIGDEVAARETVDLVVDELGHMRTLIERLSLLGQAMEPDSCVYDDVSMRAFIADIHDGCTVLAPRHWILGPVPDVVLRADVAKLRGAVLNLVDNAVKATTEGDKIMLSSSVDGTDRWVTITVSDSGPGIPPEQRAAVLDRFSRPGARAAGGSGLGLAIVKAVAEAQGGAVGVGASPLGGAEVTIILPLKGP